MIDYISGKILELIVYELKLHEPDIEHAVIEQIKHLATLIINRIEHNKLENDNGKAND
jgi:hypothetical protein